MENTVKKTDNTEMIDYELFKKYEFQYNFTKGMIVSETKPKDTLHQFFNSKSDANKYLTTEQQEDLEKEFSEYWDKLSYEQ